MKKFVLVLTMIMSFCSLAVGVYADPGPYGPPMAGDGCETEPGDPLVETPCQAQGGPEVYEAINQVFINLANPVDFPSPAYDSNADTDGVQVTTDNAYWKELSPSGEASSFAFVSISAAATNTLGIFPKGDPGSVTFFDTAFVGTGTAADPYAGAINTLSASNFGFALKSQPPSGGQKIWYSDPGLNSDGIDHMIAFHLADLEGATIWIDTNGADPGGLEEIVLTKDTYLLAWEDKSVSSSNFDSDYDDAVFLVTRIQPIPEPMTMILLGSGLIGVAGLRRRRS